MKQFDLEEYKKNPSREIVTRDGRKARIICTDVVENRYMIHYPIVALVLDIDNGREIPHTFTELGHVNHGNAEPLDLFFAPVKHKGYANVYINEYGEKILGSKISDSEEVAKTKISHYGQYFATIPIEWEE